MVNDTARHIFGSHLPFMKRNVLVAYQPIHPDAGPSPRDMYLVRIKRGAGLDDEQDDEETDTFIRFVNTLNDLRGFVKIRSETDALEFLRFGSSMMTSLHFEQDMQEVYSIRSEDTRRISPSVTWGLVEECRRANFFPPQIINPKRPTKENKEDDDEEEERRGHFFLITRTVYSSRNNDAQFLRVTEEVGPSGQWRIVASQSLGRLNKDNMPFLGLDERPENRNRPLTQEEMDEYIADIRRDAGVE